VYAYHLARTLDGEPRGDTRAGALRHPRYATLYARDVDRGPRDDTRAAALAERFSAHFYLAQVECARHPAFEPVLGAANIESMFEDIPALRASASPPPERFPASWVSATRRRGRSDRTSGHEEGEATQDSCSVDWRGYPPWRGYPRPPMGAGRRGRL
jgi:hypothetical protein